MFNLCIAFVCWDEFEQAGEFQDAHGGGRWSVKGVWAWSRFWWSWVSQAPEPECHIPFSG